MRVDRRVSEDDETVEGGYRGVGRRPKGLDGNRRGNVQGVDRETRGQEGGREEARHQEGGREEARHQEGGREEARGQEGGREEARHQEGGRQEDDDDEGRAQADAFRTRLEQRRIQSLRRLPRPTVLHGPSVRAHDGQTRRICEPSSKRRPGFGARLRFVDFVRPRMSGSPIHPESRPQVPGRGVGPLLALKSRDWALASA